MLETEMLAGSKDFAIHIARRDWERAERQLTYRLGAWRQARDDEDSLGQTAAAILLAQAYDEERMLNDVLMDLVVKEYRSGG